ncbi:heavy-metal-associated domain-containing protein [Pararhodospirillum photometricum]|nr:heavy-metal-associated domain-containing protein [Pararhodospirillum photometricum]
MAYIHSVPGRLRVKTRSFRAVEETRQLCRSLATWDGVEEVTFNPRSNSLVVIYDPARVVEDDLLAAIRAQGHRLRPGTSLLHLPAPVPAPPAKLPLSPLVGTAAAAFGGALGKALAGALIKSTIERGVVGLVSAAIR